jgi:hypothetical protein
MLNQPADKGRHRRRAIAEMHGSDAKGLVDRSSLNAGWIIHTGGTAAHHRTARIINGVGTHRRRRWGSLGFPPLDLSSISCLAACLRRPIDPSRRPPVERIFPA